MREIKFRGKRVDNGWWEYGYYLVVSEKHLIISADATISFNGNYDRMGCFGEISNEGNGWPCEVIPKTVGQYTGLKDKNGKEIYEGDIVKRTGLGLFEVVFEGDSFLAKNNHYHFLGWAGDDEREVIGNIHDNPELMEATDGKEEENN